MKWSAAVDGRKKKKKDFSPVDVRKETSSVNVPQISTQTYSTWLCLHCHWFIKVSRAPMLRGQ